MADKKQSEPTDWERRRKFQTSEAVEETLKALGLDTEDMHEMQADFAFLRRVRNLSEASSVKAITVTIAGIGAAVFFILGLGVQKLLGQ